METLQQMEILQQGESLQLVEIHSSLSFSMVSPIRRLIREVDARKRVRQRSAAHLSQGGRLHMQVTEKRRRGKRRRTAGQFDTTGKSDIIRDDSPF